MYPSVGDDDSIDFMADAKKIQQDYIRRSIHSGESSPEPVVTTVNVTSSTSHPGFATDHHAVDTMASKPGAVVVNVPASSNAGPTNAGPTTVKVPPPPCVGGPGPQFVLPPPPPSQFNGEPAPVTSTLRSIVRPQSSNSVIFRAPPRPPRDPSSTKTVTWSTQDSDGGVRK